MYVHAHSPHAPDTFWERSTPSDDDVIARAKTSRTYFDWRSQYTVFSPFVALAALASWRAHAPGVLC